MAKKITKTQGKKHSVAASRIAAIFVVAFSAVACFGTGCDWLLSKHEHIYSEWETTDATCGKDGKKERSCIVCGEKESEVLPATGKHVYGGWTTTEEATCGKNGKKEHSCTVCGSKESEVIPATGKHNLDPETNICIDCNYDPSKPTPPVTAETSDVAIHFLELGNGYAGDCVLIDCGDTEVLIDAGSQQSSAATIKKYVDEYCTDGVLEYVITTHGDQDHISGFVGTTSAKGILYQYEVGTLIKFDYSNKTTQIYKSYLDAVEYVKGNGTKVYTASQCYEEKDGAKRQYYLDEAHTVSINILYNYYYYNLDKNDENNHSVVTLLTQEYADGNKHYLFTGDLEGDGERKMVDYYANPSNSKSEFDILPKVELYKAGHHGSKTSSTEKLMKVIQPKYVTVCCVCGQPEYTKENANTFPTQDMLDRVGVYTDKIYVTSLATNLPKKDANGNYTAISKSGYTSMNGNIKFYTEDGELKLWCSKSYTILKDTEWFKENRKWNGV
ncbi:MAG: MBL fold metallo-hydrolase [Clostridia bacterium]|nr:MBL fold metallo-hydrolase [Clostridia bacterium]